MRVLQISHCYYPPFLDCTRQYASLFQGTSYKVLTIYLTGEPSEEVATASASDQVIFLGYKSNEVSGLKLDALTKIKQIIGQESFAFCIAHRVKPTYLALLATNLPLISVHHNYNDYRKFSRRLLVNFYKSRILMLGVSNSVRDDLRHSLRSWDSERIQTLYNHVDVLATQRLMLTKMEARVELQIPEGAWVFGNVGRLHRDKDQATLLRGFAMALPYLPSNSLLVIIGFGPLESDLKELTISLGLSANVIFTGQVHNAKRYFKAFDVFVLSSDKEPFGMVLLEAMAAELPIICADCGGGAEVVKDVGALFEFGNEVMLKECLIRAYLNTSNLNNIQAINKLNRFFTDEAARKHFWTLPYIVELLKGN